MHELNRGSKLQGGKYTIEYVLGQGGFGITYKGITESALAGNLGGMTVEVPIAIKEFFLKDFCVRNTESSYVSIPTTGSREQLDKYRQKFIKEARNIATLSHDNIVKVLDVFEENGTVYYAMQFLNGGSLRDLVKQNGPLPEERALKYIRQIADALGYMHQKKHICHLDVKPGNILLDKSDNAKLIDFGISKSYDEHGNETSSTPVGLSQGYAPLEQYQNSLHDFSPVTDIYSLGATLYYLLTGETPPEAALVLEDGLGDKPQQISTFTWQAIEAAMKPLRKERPQTTKDFIKIIDEGLEKEKWNEKTQVVIPTDEPTKPVVTPPVNPSSIDGPQPSVDPSAHHPQPPVPEINEDDDNASSTNWIVYVFITLIVAVIAFGLIFAFSGNGSSSSEDIAAADSAEVVQEVTDFPVTIEVGGEKKSFQYTGPINIDNMPEGVGTAIYTTNVQGVTSTYEGGFVNGLRNDSNAKLTFSNGDVYQGGFVDDFFSGEGKYTFADGSYFKGEYREGKEYNGSWYDKSGNVFAKVVYGKDQ